VGVDLSYAIESAHKNIGSRPNVHLAQADLFHLPFPQKAFDCIFSIGVLHHTPDCRNAVLGLIPFLKDGGTLAVWVYPKYKLHTLCRYSPERFTARPGELPYVLQAPFRVSSRWMPVVARSAIWVDRLNNLWNGTVRAIARRLPVKALYALCHAAIPLYHVLKLRPFTPLRLIFKISMHPDPEWRVLDTFDNLSPRYQSRHTYEEVRGWFEEGGLKNIILLPNQIAVRGQR
jgi:SAM-dependent methyltransferase